MEVSKMSLTIFAQRMKQARESKKMKQNELAKAIGVTPTTISSYEKSDDEGNGKKPTLENAKAIAEKLEVSLDWLSGLYDNNGTGVSYADFNIKGYLRSIITILNETTTSFEVTASFDGDIQRCIVINNPEIAEFAKKVKDLINVYHSGTITEDLFDVCIEKILNDYNNLKIFGSCILDETEDINKDKIYDYIKTDKFTNPGIMPMAAHSIDDGLDSFRDIDVFISQKIIDTYKETPDNGKHTET
ncbi:MAG: helix-turn-helix transcriptional regulator [Oscillospiraceae bacterium]|nr:helix-turn-helix transcriptional regulator [Oscillospiraceae bacterium]